ncbi:hypothetical protein Ancab_017286, partial [Ancistrocladus abbreviatus]
KVDSDWLKECFVGEVCSVEMIDNLEEELRVDGVRCTARNMGGRLVLLFIQDGREMKEFLEKEGGKLSKWFSSIRPWTTRTVDSCRTCWVTCYGVPLHALSEVFFEDFASLWGLLAWVDQRMSSRSNLEFVWLSIFTSSPRNIQDSVNIKIGEDVFTVLAIEERMFFSDKKEYIRGP